ncbi:unnamed protein product [Leuciscus chuanchicus]
MCLIHCTTTTPYQRLIWRCSAARTQLWIRGSYGGVVRPVRSCGSEAHMECGPYAAVDQRLIWRCSAARTQLWIRGSYGGVVRPVRSCGSEIRLRLIWRCSAARTQLWIRGSYGGVVRPVRSCGSEAHMECGPYAAVDQRLIWRCSAARTQLWIRGSYGGVVRPVRSCGSEIRLRLIWRCSAARTQLWIRGSYGGVVRPVRSCGSEAHMEDDVDRRVLEEVPLVLLNQPSVPAVGDPHLTAREEDQACGHQHHQTGEQTQDGEAEDLAAGHQRSGHRDRPEDFVERRRREALGFNSGLQLQLPHMKFTGRAGESGQAGAADPVAHLPPFRHGLGSQTSSGISQNVPVNPAGHRQRLAEQDPPF